MHKVYVGPEKDSKGRITAWAIFDGKSYALASVAAQAIENPEVHSCWLDFVKVIATEFFGQMGIGINEFIVTKEGDMN